MAGTSCSASDAPAITALALTDFRNHAGLTLSAGPGLVVISGDNGLGKTNILEAISWLAPGRGLRGAALAECARQGGPGGFSVAATLAQPSGAVALGTGTLAAAPDKRQVRINGATRPAIELAEWLALSWLTPAMDRLFTGPAGDRRRFLDRLVLALHPGHGRAVARYEAAMRERSRLLAGDAPPDPAWLTALEAQMAEAGQLLAAARADVVTALATALAVTPPGPFAQPLLALAGNDAADLAGQLALARARDAAAGRALSGPHRAELLVSHAGKGVPAAQCSTGEQKALLISLVLAHARLVTARRGRQPILLLDEVAAHLDAGRRAALFGQLQQLGSQVWMTGTDAELFAGSNAASWFNLPLNKASHV
jgi:DNA replication and repair protein RecF